MSLGSEEVPEVFLLDFLSVLAAHFHHDIDFLLADPDVVFLEKGVNLALADISSAIRVDCGKDHVEVLGLNESMLVLWSNPDRIPSRTPPCSISCSCCSRPSWEIWWRSCWWFRLRVDSANTFSDEFFYFLDVHVALGVFEVLVNLFDGVGWNELWHCDFQLLFRIIPDAIITKTIDLKSII